jgi:serine/threonine-protein kinase RsbW
VNRESVMVRIPPTPEHLALLRTAVAGFAARDHFTLDQVDDLRLAVEEAAVQLLKHVAGEGLTLTVSRTEPGVEVRLSADVSGDEPVIDEESFSWVILRALADDVSVEMQQGHGAIVLAKHRLASAPHLDQDEQDEE